MTNQEAFNLMGEGGYNSTAPMFERSPGFMYDGAYGTPMFG